MEEKSNTTCATKLLEEKEKDPKPLPPARAPASSIRNAVNIGALVTGVFSLISGSFISTFYWRYGELSCLVQAMMGFSFITVIMNAVIIFSLLNKDDRILKYAVCATMAVHMVALPFSAFGVLGIMLKADKFYYDVPVWEMPRFFICLVHLGLMYCLLAELRGDPLPPMDPSPPPPPEAGWLKNNLARTGPPPPAADDALLKLQVEQNNLGGGDGPAVFAPSSCTTAAPVHSVYSPAPANIPVSGPVSTSEA